MEAAFIAAIVAAPKTVEPWLAYRDWLLERRDRRGEWIRLALEGGEEVSRRRLIPEEGLLTARLNEQAHLLNFGWWRGFIVSAALIGAMDDPPTFETIDALFADPHTALLSNLGIGHPITETVPLWQAVLATERPTITKLHATDLGSGLQEIGRKLPRLRSLVLGSMTVRVLSDERIEHDQLRHLVTDARSCPALSSGNFKLPNLESLTWQMFEFSEVSDREAAPLSSELFTASRSILHRAPPSLVELKLSGSMSSARDLRTLSEGRELGLLESCPALVQLRRLHLSLGMTTYAVLRELLSRAGSFRHLESIEVTDLGRRPRDEVDAIKADLERALPNTKLDVRWEDLIRNDPNAPSNRPDVVDSQSRNKDGRIDAIARWMSSGGSRHG